MSVAYVTFPNKFHPEKPRDIIMDGLIVVFLDIILISLDFTDKFWPEEVENAGVRKLFLVTGGTVCVSISSILSSNPNKIILYNECCEF